MHHQDKARSSKWLKDLKVKNYIEWIYNDTDIIQRSRPAIYYIGLNGIRYLRELDEYPQAELRKRYTESSRKQAFIDRCILLADSCLNMDTRTADGSKVSYSYVTEADFANPDNEYHFLLESEFIHPHLCYVKKVDSGDAAVTKSNLLEVIDARLPRYSLRKRLKDYVNFLNSDEWEEETDDDELPIILIACPDKAELIYAKRITRQVLIDTYGDDDDDVPEEVHIRFTTVDMIKLHGITGKIWEEV